MNAGPKRPGDLPTARMDRVSMGFRPVDGLHIEPGQLIEGRFRIVKLLGDGAMSEVWLAEDLALHGDAVALKFLRRDLLRDPVAINDLKQEVVLARRLRHPNIIGVYTLYENQDCQFIAMEYAEGKNLSDCLDERQRPFTPEEVAPWLAQLCDALDYAHRRGVLHRDIKPANILVTNEGDVRLLDFGIARAAEELRAQEMAVVCGTLMFMSPEQVSGRPLDHRSDQYSLGCTVYELLNGLPPFCDGDVVTLIQTAPARPAPHLSSGINKVLLTCIAKNPNDRYPDCSSFAAAFQEAVDAAFDAPQPAITARDRRAREETVRLAQPEPYRRPRLGEVLADAGVITRRQLSEALEHQRGSTAKLGEVLQELGWADEDAIVRAVNAQLGIPIVNLDETPLALAVRDSIPREFLIERRVLPFQREGMRALVAMADPLDLETAQALERFLGMRVDPVIARASAILAAIERMYSA